MMTLEQLQKMLDDVNAALKTQGMVVDDRKLALKKQLEREIKNFKKD